MRMPGLKACRKGWATEPRKVTALSNSLRSLSKVTTSPSRNGLCKPLASMVFSSTVRGAWFPTPVCSRSITTLLVLVMALVPPA